MMSETYRKMVTLTETVREEETDHTKQNNSEYLQSTNEDFEMFKGFLGEKFLPILDRYGIISGVVATYELMMPGEKKREYSPKPNEYAVQAEILDQNFRLHYFRKYIRDNDQLMLAMNQHPNPRNVTVDIFQANGGLHLYCEPFFFSHPDKKQAMARGTQFFADGVQYLDMLHYDDSGMEGIRRDPDNPNILRFDAWPNRSIDIDWNKATPEERITAPLRFRSIENHLNGHIRERDILRVSKHLFVEYLKEHPEELPAVQEAYRQAS